MNDDDPILTTRQAALVLGVSVSTAQHWMESGAIPSWKTPGGHRRAYAADIKRAALARQGAFTRHRGPVPVEFLPADENDFPVPDNEASRLVDLFDSCLIGSEPTRQFDRLAWLATRLAETPIALVSLLTAERQWFKARVGLGPQETPRSWAFCSYAILQREPFVVPDALLDERFRLNPLVTGEPHIRFYAGFPLTTSSGNRLGTLCVIDRKPRQLSHDQMVGLSELANIASEEIDRIIGQKSN